MKTFVVDASFVLQAVLSSRDAPVKRLYELVSSADRGSIRIIAPSLFVYEISNGLRYSVKDIELIETILVKISQFPIDIQTLSLSHMLEVSRMALANATTVYDSSYHFLAMLHQGIFLTCDSEYYKKAKDSVNIELL